MAKFSVMNYLWRKAFPRLPRGGRVVLHLGCGDHYLSNPGFINIDGNLFCRKDLWLDITLGLPFPECSIDIIFASHLLEHLSEKQVRKVLNECYRVLKPNGAARFVTPNLRKAIEAYVQGDLNFFSNWPDRRKSIGGKFNNDMLCRDQHRLMFDFSYLQELLADAGFNKWREVTPLESAIFSAEELRAIQWEKAEDHRSLFVEAFKTVP